MPEDVPLQTLESPSLVRDQLARILASPEFGRAPRLSRLLTFLVERGLGGTASEVKEYVLATEVFDRGHRYDPRRDPIVRVQARQLRLRLAAYYETHGAADPLIIDIPLGGYVARIRRRVEEVHRSIAVPAAPASLASPAAAMDGVSPPIPGASGADEHEPLPVAAVPPLPWVSMRGWSVLLLGSAAAVATITCLALLFEEAPAQRTGAAPSVAVLPFVVSGSDDAGEYLGDGLAAAVIDSLARVGGLRVIAPRSAFAFKGRPADLRLVAASLRVAHVLEGSVGRDAARVRVTARLVRADDLVTVWSGTIERPAEAIGELQDELAGAVSRALSVQVAPDWRSGVRTSAQPGVHDLCFRARHLWNQRDADALRLAVGLFERAIGLDPTYAPAHAGVAATWAVLYGNGIVAPDEGAAKARAAAARALELDADSALAHAVLASVEATADYAWETANDRFVKALAIQPGDATVRHWYGLNLVALGQLDAALVELRRAQEADPLSMAIAYSIGEVLVYARRGDLAWRQARSMAVADPTYGGVPILETKALTLLGRHDEAIAAAERTSLPELFVAAALAADRGRQDEARHRADALAATDVAERLPFALAAIYAQLGDREATFRWLQDACRRRQADVVSVKVDPAFDTVRGDPRYTALLSTLGLD
jgi:TolB-like protein